MVTESLKSTGSLRDEEADTLVSFLNDDQALRQWLYSDEVPPLARDEFRELGREWEQKNHAQTYAIFTHAPVGQISLSHMTADGKARIGYWLASREWKRGITTRAFELMLEKARELGIREINAHIEVRNTASLRLWQKFGVTQEKLGDYVRVRLELQNAVDHSGQERYNHIQPNTPSGQGDGGQPPPIPDRW